MINYNIIVSILLSVLKALALIKTIEYNYKKTRQISISALALKEHSEYTLSDIQVNEADALKARGATLKVRDLQVSLETTRRPASADRTARRQFQATGQPVSRTQSSDAMTLRLPRYEAKCVQRRCFQCGSVPLRSAIKGTELPPANIFIPLERQLIALQLCS